MSIDTQYHLDLISLYLFNKSSNIYIHFENNIYIYVYNLLLKKKRLKKKTIYR
jgi:hypothetical protein